MRKRTLKGLGIFAIMATACLNSQAAVSDGNATNTLDAPESGYDFVKGGIYYKIRYDNTVTTSAGEKPYSGDIVIPDEVSHNGVTYRVTKVAGFHNSPDVTSITIPRYTRRIARFYGGINIWVNSGAGIKAPGKLSETKSVNPDEPKAKLHKIIFNAVKCDTVYRYVYETTLLGGYYGGRVTAFPESVTEVVIGDEVENIPQGLLYNCHQLNKLTFTRSVKTIGKGIIAPEYDNLTDCTLDCDDLHSMNWFPKDMSALKYGTNFVTLPAGWYNSNNCPEHIIVPSNFKKIAPEAFFSGCTNLKSITLPEGLTEIGENAFYCRSMTDINLPNSIEKIGDNAFYYTGISEAILPASIKYIGKNAFRLKKVTVNSLFRENNEAAPTYQAQLGLFDELTVGGAIDSIPMEEFNISNLKKLNFEEGVRYIGTKAFMDAQFTEIKLPNSLIALAPSAFESNGYLKNITFGNNINSIGPRAFAYTAIESITLPESITEIPEGLFSWNEKLTTVNMSDNIETIKTLAFRGCSNLKNIVLNKSLKKIESQAFYNAGLELFDLSSCLVDTIEMFAFRDCLKLQKVIDNARYTDPLAFWKCNNLEEFTIGNNAENISLTDLPNLRKLTVGSNKLEYARFLYCPIEEVILTDEVQIVPDLSSCPITKLTFSNNIREFPEGALFNSKLRDIVIPEYVEKIGRRTFGGTDVETIEWNAVNVPNYNNDMFAMPDSVHQPKIKSITIGENVKFVGNIRYLWDKDRGNFVYNPSIYEKLYFNAKFYDDHEGTYVVDGPWNYSDKIIIGNEVTRIPQDFACHNTSIKEITIPQSVSQIGNRAFSDCYGLNIYMENPAPPVADEHSFANIKGNINAGEPAILYVPLGAKKRYREAPVWKDFINIVELECLGGVDDVTIDENAGSNPVYYNLNGLKIDNPAPGFYIVKRGTNISKELIK